MLNRSETQLNICLDFFQLDQRLLEHILQQFEFSVSAYINMHLYYLYLEHSWCFWTQPAPYHSWLVHRTAADTCRPAPEGPGAPRLRPFAPGADRTPIPVSPAHTGAIGLGNAHALRMLTCLPAHLLRVSMEIYGCELVILDGMGDSIFLADGELTPKTSNCCKICSRRR